MHCNSRLRGRLMRRRRLLKQSIALAGLAALTRFPAAASATDDGQVFVCTNPDCDPYVYEPAQGDGANIVDPGRPIAPGTPFAQLPETWRCPLCGAPKATFLAYDLNSANTLRKGGR